MIAVAEQELMSAGQSGDATDRIASLTDSATGAIDWTYDVLDQVTQEVTPQGIVRYTYDAISQRLTMRVNAQSPVTYGYDANSQLSHVTQGTLSATLTHDALGRRTQLQRSNGVTTTYNYDPASRLQGITHAKGSTTLEQLTHGFDPADNKTQATQLIQTATALPPAVTAAYNAVNAQIQFNSGTLGYDPNGNLTNDGTSTYVWDARDRLVSLSGGTSATFTYDALDRRIAKTINGALTTYLYDGADMVTESGTSNASYLSTLNIDEPLVRQTSSGNEFFHTDDLGSTLALTNDAGAVTTTYTYGPFGATTVNGTSTNPVQFTGRENDGNGLYYYRARYYSPSHSRFLSEDPLEFDAGDPNLYVYVFNNPMNFVDPTGEKIRLPQPIKNCLLGMLKAAGIDLAKRKSATDPDTLADAAQGCGGGQGNKGANTNNAKPSKQKPRFIGDDKGNIVDTNATPPGSYTQPDRSRTDILQDRPHRGLDPFTARTHTHPATVHQNPQDPSRGSTNLGDPRPVTTDEVRNIMNSTATSSRSKGR
jgi:RHS repeat-associated protein